MAITPLCCAANAKDDNRIQKIRDGIRSLYAIFNTFLINYSLTALQELILEMSPLLIKISKDWTGYD